MKNLRTPALRKGLLPAAILAAVAPAAAFAQEQSTTGTTELDRIQVTGSRIRGVEIENQQPIMTISREQITQSGAVNVADLLQNVSSAGSPAISRADALASGENVGGYYIDIRNLGATRTLVLLNGVRLGATTAGYQDLSQIPMAAIERIDILKDGASSIYGSDAIAAVVNVITRSRFDGAEASVQFGEFTDGDGGETIYSGTFGVSNDRGGITVSAEVMESDPILASSRWFSAFGDSGPEFPGSGWSPISQNGSWFNPAVGDWVTLRPGGDPANAADYVPHDETFYANPNEQMYLQTGLDRKSVFANINYDLSERVTFNSDIIYNRRTTDQLIAGYPYQSQAFGTPLSADSAFNPTGEDIEFRRRLWEMPRSTRSELTTFRVVAGLNGYFDVNERPWDWSVSFASNRNKLTKTSHGDASLLASEVALGPSFIDASGVAQCGTPGNAIDGCVPWNPLLPYGVAGQGALSDPALQTFMFPYYTDTGETSTKIYSASLTGGLFALPAGDLAFAAGVEYREETGRFVPDAFNQSGMSTGLPATTTEGEYDVSEAYLEVNIPVLADKAFAKELTVNLATRYSDYSNFGDTTNSKASFLWRPTDTLAVRATWAQGFRAPSIDNLYGGIGGSFESYVDPCSLGAPGSVAGNGPCTGAGVAPDYVQLGQGLVPCTSWPCQTPDQFISGSNPELGPEESISKTAGIVWSPGFAEGLTLSLDWYNYKITNAIVADSVGDILRDCYVLGNAERCDGVTRDPNDGHISGMFYGLTNLGQMETEGWDLGVRYNLAETSFGAFAFDWQTSYTSTYDEQGKNSDGDPITIGVVGVPGLFRIRSTLGVTWAINDSWSTSWNMRYYSGINDSCVTNGGCTDPDRYQNGEPDPWNRRGSNTFHNATVSYNAPWNATVTLGVKNVFDHKAGILFSGGGVSTGFPYYPEFDIGRFVYMNYTQRF